MSPEPVHVILNPAAGRGRGQWLEPQIRRLLTESNIPFELVQTHASGEAIALARQAKQQGYTTIVAAGGDGTIHEVINGMAEVTPPGETVGRLALLPIGTGNDFVSALGGDYELRSNRTLAAAIRSLQSGQRRFVDLAQVTLSSTSGSHQRYFNNNLGLGFEAEVTRASQRITFARGPLVYLLGILHAIRTATPSEITVGWHSPNGASYKVTRSLLMVTVGNGDRAGGGFRLHPNAQLSDGLLDLGLVYPISRLSILTLLLKVLRGDHLQDRRVFHTQCRHLSISWNEPIPLQIDGELIEEGVRSVDISVQPNLLELCI
jgi:diacylglycerol kinase (ATP)